MKIGLVQNVAVAGDLSANLRQVVQGCRACLNEGADLAIASAQAIDGVFLDGLRFRSSFLLQAHAALAALAAELSKPLLLASHAALPGEGTALPRPYLLDKGAVQPLLNRRVHTLAGARVFIDVGPQPTPPPPGTECDAVVHLPTAPWAAGQSAAWLAAAQAEAAPLRLGALVVQGVGADAARAFLMGGGSLAASKRGSMQLPYFRAAERVWSSTARYSAPLPGESLLQAACFCLRELVRLGGYRGAAVWDASPRAALLTALAQAALGKEGVVTLSFDAALAASRQRSTTVLPALAQSAGDRVRSAQLADYAAGHGLLLLSDRTLSDTLLGHRAAPLYEAFAPLGDMLESEAATLCNELEHQLHTSLPHAPETSPEDEAVLRLMTEANMSPLELAATRGIAESTSRSILRRMQAAAPQWAPSSLRRMRIRPEMPLLPIGHRLCE